MKKISIIISVYNEEEALEEFYRVSLSLIHILARYSRAKLPGEKAAENLRLFDENYITSDMVKQEVKENE